MFMIFARRTWAACVLNGVNAPDGGRKMNLCTQFLQINYMSRKILDTITGGQFKKLKNYVNPVVALD